jgi:hypothetical protein
MREMRTEKETAGISAGRFPFMGGTDGCDTATEHGDALAGSVARAVRTRRHDRAESAIATDGRPRASRGDSHSGGTIIQPELQNRCSSSAAAS